jgi:acetyl-CoA acetyltransferase
MGLPIRSKAAIVGLGCTEYLASSPLSNMKLTSQAFKAALADAGLSHQDVDGITTHLGTPYGDDYDQIATALGLNIRHASQYFTHGRFVTLSLQNAALAVMTGLADVVACVMTFRTESLDQSKWVAAPGAGDREGARQGGGPHGQQPAFGLSSMASGAALSARRYMETYGVSEEGFMHTVLSARAHAARNPRALLHDSPLSAEQYMAQPYVMDPLRAADDAKYGDGSVVVLVASAERAEQLRRPPVYIRGMQGLRTGREEFLFARRGLGVSQQGTGPNTPDRQPHQVFDMAGVAPSDIDAFYTYDIFSPFVLFALERFGHCRFGEAAEFVASGGIAPGGRLPVNTNGGMLAEVHLSGWNNIAEIVRQLRGEAGPTQLPDARVLQWGTTFGDSIIFGSEP